MIFTGHYIAATEGVYFWLNCAYTPTMPTQSQPNVNRKQQRIQNATKSTHSFTWRAWLGPNRHHGKKMMHKKYVSHYSNKNGQFILRNVQILCIIYITFCASAHFFLLFLRCRPYCYRTFFYYTHIKHTLHFIHSFVLLLSSPSQTFPSYICFVLLFFCIFRFASPYTYILLCWSWRWCISMCVLFVMFTIFFLGILWQQKSWIRRAQTHMT